MTSKFLFMAAVATMMPMSAALAQMSSMPAQGSSMSGMSAGSMSASDVGVSPLTGTSATDYVKLSADGDNFEKASGKIAASRGSNKAIRSYGKQMVADHTGTTKSVMAALTNQDRKIAPPSMKLSADNQAKIDLLKRTPKASFDQLYLQQQAQSHQTAWALQKGYATDGTDAPLRQVAMTAVPVVEQHISELKAMSGGMSGGM